MPIDPSIILGVKPPQLVAPDPLERYTKSLTLRHLLQQGELTDIQTQSARDTLAEQQGVRSVFRNAPAGSTLESLLPELYKASPKTGIEYQGKLIDQQTKKATLEHTKAQTGEISAGQIAGGLAALARGGGSDSSVQQVVDMLTPTLGADHGESLRATLLQMQPQQRVAFMIQEAAKHKNGIDALKTLFPAAHMQDFGGTVAPVSTSTIPGAPAPGSVIPGAAPIAKTVTPDAALTDQRTRSEGAANRGVTMRGQNMTDARARELNASTKLSQPFEATIDGRPVLVQQDKITGQIVDVNTKRVVGNVAPKAGDAEQLASGYARRMTEAEKLLAEHPAGEKPGITESIAARVPLVGKPLSNVARPEERQLYRQAQEDWVRAKLRKESGAVIGEEEMDREIRTYFPQIGDGPAVMRQKAAARKTAISAMEQAAGPAVRPTSSAASPAPAAGVTQADIDAELRRRGVIR